MDFKSPATYRMIDIAKTHITITPNLSERTPGYLEKVTDKQLPLLTLLQPPVLLSVGSTYQLVEKLWCYKIQVQHHVSKILFLVFDNRAEYEYYNKKIPPIENAWIDSLIGSLVRMTSKATIARHKAISTHRRCPFCNDALMAPRGTWIPDKNGYYRAHCYNSKQARCDFYILLSESEKIKFRSYEFDIDEMLVPVVDKKCKICGKQIYLRLLHMQDGNIVYIEMCRNYRLSTKLSCNYAVKLQGAPSWLSRK